MDRFSLAQVAIKAIVMDEGFQQAIPIIGPEPESKPASLIALMLADEIMKQFGVANIYAPAKTDSND